MQKSLQNISKSNLAITFKDNTSLTKFIPKMVWNLKTNIIHCVYGTVWSNEEKIFDKNSLLISSKKKPSAN